MKQYGFFKKCAAVLLAFSLIAGANCVQMVVLADDSYDYNSLSLEEKQAVIEQKLKEANEKLDQLGTESEETEGYINALDEKISYLNQEKKLLKETINNTENKISSLQKEISVNEEDIAANETEIAAAQENIDLLTEDFQSTYEDYCRRLRAMYISGNTSVLSFLITCRDISTLLTRYEMVKRISERDNTLLQGIQSQCEELVSATEELEAKQQELIKNQTALEQNKKELEKSMIQLQEKQDSYETKEAEYVTEKKKSDTLLEQLHADTQTYSEYRNQDEEELAAIQAEIDAAIAKAAREYETAATTTTEATKTTAENSEQPSDHNEKDDSTTVTKDKTIPSSSYIQFTYPVPTQTTITTGFYGYEGHSGVDFSCATGSRVVAAESGTVIISADLTNSDGSYRSYGRYIVIAHDKTTSSGERVYTLYAHNSERVVSAGEYVTKGQLIAYSGSTGNSTGPHCHFEVRTPGSSYSDCVDPEKYLP